MAAGVGAFLALAVPAAAQTPTVPGYDSVSLSTIPSDAQVIGCYTAGLWPTCDAVARDFPHAMRVTIAISASLLTFHGQPIDCLDIETGDATIPQARAWNAAEIRLGEAHPCDYTSESQMPWLHAAVAGQPVLFWDAAYDGDPSLRGFDAHQWTDRALGRSLDADTFSVHFLQALGLVPTVVKPARVHCYGPHARVKLVKCKAIRANVRKWSHARDATLRAMNAHRCAVVALSGQTVNAKLDQGKVCVTLAKRANWFQARIHADLY